MTFVMPSGVLRRRIRQFRCLARKWCVDVRVLLADAAMGPKSFMTASPISRRSMEGSECPILLSRMTRQLRSAAAQIAAGLSALPGGCWRVGVAESRLVRGQCALDRDSAWRATGESGQRTRPDLAGSKVH